MKNRKNYSISRIVIGVFATLLLVVMPAVAMAQRAVDPQLGKKVRHELVMLPYYGIFDNLAYSINGGNVTLYGQVVRPSTRSDAERRVRKIAGVTRVVNNIKVLPLSPFDDRIRSATYRSIAHFGLRADFRTRSPVLTRIGQSRRHTRITRPGQRWLRSSGPSGWQLSRFSRTSRKRRGQRPVSPVITHSRFARWLTSLPDTSRTIGTSSPNGISRQD